MTKHPPRPEWWPRYREPYSLLTIVALLRSYQQESDHPESPHIIRYAQDAKAVCIRALSHACRNWISPSTPYEHALYSLCLAALEEAQRVTAQENMT